MKSNFLIITVTLLLCNVSFSQTEKVIESKIKQVTVFTSGAQIEREAEFNVLAGQNTYKLSNLSPHIKKESIRINGDRSFVIVNVQHRNDFVNELDRNKELESINHKIEGIQYQIDNDRLDIQIIKDKLDFLNANKSIASSNKSISPESFKSFKSIYGSDIALLHKNKLSIQRQIRTYQKQIDKLSRQKESLDNRSDLPSGTILITLKADANLKAKIDFNYLVNQASWNPSYDAKFVANDKPIHINYKANIKQNTGVDWKDIDLILSTAQTNISAQIPEFEPLLLEYYVPPIKPVTARKVKSETSELRGSTAGVNVKDYSGNNSQIRIRGNSSYSNDDDPLVVVDGLPIEGGMESIDKNSIDTFSILKDASSTAIYGNRGSNGVILITTKKGADLYTSVPLTVSTQTATSKLYSISGNQSVLSNNKTTTINYKKAEIDATFEYETLPKFSQNVFLIGKIKDWYKAELLNGEVNVYLENSFVGKSYIDNEQYKETLSLSFGVDNNVSIKRERLTEFTENKFIGLNKTKTRAYKITVRNNKSYPIKTKVTEQIPISTDKDIKVEILEWSGGKLNNEEGKVEWDISLAPNETKEIILKYSVKFPKHKKVIIE